MVKNKTETVYMARCPFCYVPATPTRKAQTCTECGTSFVLTPKVHKFNYDYKTFFQRLDKLHREWKNDETISNLAGGE